jgi:hypothetical protein
MGLALRVTPNIRGSRRRHRAVLKAGATPGANTRALYFSFSGNAKTKSVEAGCAICAADSG